MYLRYHLQYARRTLRRLPLDLRCVSHSGIRFCCILWFVTGWQWGLNASYAPWQAAKLYNAAVRLWGRFDHIPCPLCLMLGRVVEVQECDC